MRLQVKICYRLKAEDAGLIAENEPPPIAEARGQTCFPSLNLPAHGVTSVFIP